MASGVALKKAAEFYGCRVEDLEYYIRLGGPDPTEYIPDGPVDEDIVNEARLRADKLVSLAENVSCLEMQPPSGFMPELCKKIITWRKVSGKPV